MAQATVRRSPFADMPEPVQQLRRALLRDPGGDRVMAQVLTIVPKAGLDAVLVAMQLALESTRQGCVSVEHVPDVLARLNAHPVPESAATVLQVATKPLANMGPRAPRPRRLRLRGVAAGPRAHPHAG